jgi:hypothetical protein
MGVMGVMGVLGGCAAARRSDFDIRSQVPQELARAREEESPDGLV